MPRFDDSWLESPDALDRADPLLRRLASSGARLRREADAAALDRLTDEPRPRAVVATGSEARLIRAVLEPTCPVPFVAWPSHGLPGWVGPLDLVVVLATGGSDAGLVATVREAVRRGCRLLVAAPAVSTVAEHASGRSVTLLPTTTGDPVAAVIVMLAALHRFGLGPQVDLDQAADALDQVAEDCSPHHEIGQNPAKDLACAIGDGQPLVWGGSVLAARASRRVAEALRAASGRIALAADAQELLPVVAAVETRDLFADPFDDDSVAHHPVLVILDDGRDDEIHRVNRTRLRAEAEHRNVRVCEISNHHNGPIERYLAVLQEGLYGAAYLAIGLGRYSDGPVFEGEGLS